MGQNKTAPPRRYAERTEIRARISVHDDDGGANLGRIGDLGKRGMRVVGRKPIPVTRRVSFRLDLPPDLDLPATIFVDGVCRWCVQIHGTEMFESGIEFVPISGDTRKTLDRLIEALA